MDKLKTTTLSVVIGLSAAVIAVMAFTGPESSPPSGDTNFWRVNGSDIYYTGGNVGIGTTTPSAAFSVIGDVKLSGGDIITNSLAAGITSDTTFYISPGGSDSAGNGTSGSPWASLNKVGEYLSKTAYIDPSVTITVNIANGSYAAQTKAAYFENIPAKLVLSSSQTISGANMLDITTTGTQFHAAGDLTGTLSVGDAVAYYVYLTNPGEARDFGTFTITAISTSGGNTDVTVDNTVNVNYASETSGGFVYQSAGPKFYYNGSDGIVFQNCRSVEIDGFNIKGNSTSGKTGIKLLNTRVEMFKDIMMHKFERGIFMDGSAIVEGGRIYLSGLNVSQSGASGWELIRSDVSMGNDPYYYPYLVISHFGADGVRIHDGSSMGWKHGASSSSNKGNGIYVYNHSSVSYPTVTSACHNGANGLFVNTFSSGSVSFWAPHSYNAGYGVRVYWDSQIYIDHTGGSNNNVGGDFSPEKGVEGNYRSMIYYYN